jgi:quinol monooxygenase YgiN
MDGENRSRRLNFLVSRKKEKKGGIQIMKKLSVVATIKAKQGNADEVRSELLKLIEPTRGEAGCINYDLHQLLDDPNCFVFYENWESKDHLDQHLASAHISVFLEKADKLLSEPIEIKLLEMISPD